MIEVRIVRRIGFKNIREEALREIEEGLVETIKGEGKPPEELIYAPTGVGEDEQDHTSQA